MDNIYSLCVFGHRNMTFTEQDEIDLYNLFEDFIINKKVGIFNIKRVYICEDYKFISRPQKRPKWLKDEDYETFEYFDMEYTGFYSRIYFRNCEIIDHSDYCVFCIDENAEYSGALKALQYAKKNHKEIINTYNST